MNKLFFCIVILLISILYSCKIKKPVVKKIHAVSAKSPAEFNYYNSLFVFGDSSYRFYTHFYDSSNSIDAEQTNTIVTFSNIEAKAEKIIFQDSLFCMYPQIELQDFNNDKIEDILVLHNTSARSNPTYYLYLVDKKNKMLIRVKNFEQLPNPDFDVENNIIVNYALSGNNYYSFYRIDKNNKLINLGFAFTENENDPGQYTKAINGILKKYN